MCLNTLSQSRLGLHRESDPGSVVLRAPPEPPQVCLPLQSRIQDGSKMDQPLGFPPTDDLRAFCAQPIGSHVPLTEWRNPFKKRKKTVSVAEVVWNPASVSNLPQHRSPSNLENVLLVWWLVYVGGFYPNTQLVTLPRNLLGKEDSCSYSWWFFTLDRLDSLRHMVLLYKTKLS